MHSWEDREFFCSILVDLIFNRLTVQNVNKMKRKFCVRLTQPLTRSALSLIQMYQIFATLLAIFMQFTHSATSVREKATETLFFYQR